MAKKITTTPIPPSFPLRKNTAGEREPGEYSTGQWAGKAQYQCRSCGFDVLEDRWAMLEHLMSVHGSTWALEELVRMEAEDGRAPLALTALDQQPVVPTEITPAAETQENQVFDDLKEDHNA